MLKVLSNLPIKIIVILLAIGFWVFIALQTGKIGNFPADIPIEIKNLNPDLAVALSEQNVVARISATPAVWQGLTIDNFKAYIDATAKTEGVYQLNVQVSIANQSVELIAISPPSVLVNIEKNVSQSVSVEMVYDGAPKENYSVADFNLTPKTIVAKASPSTFKKIAKHAIVVSLSDASANFSKIYSIKAFDSANNIVPNVVYEPKEISADITIGKSSNIKTVGIKPIFTDEIASGYSVQAVTVVPSTIAISGPATEIASISYIETNPISLSNKNADFNIDINIKMPSGVLVVDSIKQVEVAVKIGLLSNEKIISTNKFMVENLNGKYQLESTLPSAILIKITGASELLAQVNNNDINVNLNLSLVNTSQKYDVAIKPNDIKLPEGITLITYSPSVVSVNVTEK